MLSHIWKSISHETFSVTWGFFEILDDWDCFWDRSSHRFSHWHAHHRRRTGGKGDQTNERTKQFEEVAPRHAKTEVHNPRYSIMQHEKKRFAKADAESPHYVTVQCLATEGISPGGEGGCHIRVYYNFGASCTKYWFRLLILILTW